MSEQIKTLSEAAQLVSDEVFAQLNVEGAAPKTETDNAPYNNHLERSGFTVEQATKLKQADKTFVAGVMDATARVGLAAVVAGHLQDGKLKTTVPGVKGEEFEVQWTNHKHGNIPGKDGQPDKAWNSYGSLQAKHRSTTDTKGGEIGTAISLAAAAAEALLKKE